MSAPFLTITRRGVILMAAEPCKFDCGSCSKCIAWQNAQD